MTSVDSVAKVPAGAGQRQEVYAKRCIVVYRFIALPYGACIILLPEEEEGTMDCSSLYD
jgi:hypothetical protein